MGNCALVPKSREKAPSKYRCSSYSRTECILIPEPAQQHAGHTPKPHVTGYPELSDEDDVQFCSEPYVESDGDDFFSVNNDLTPSRRSISTPMQQHSEIEVVSPILISHKNKSQVQPAKQLIELFHESSITDESGDPLDGHQEEHYDSEAESDLPRSSMNTSPYHHTVADLVSGVRTRKATQFAQSFLPKLVQILNFSERKRG